MYTSGKAIIASLLFFLLLNNLKAGSAMNNAIKDPYQLPFALMDVMVHGVSKYFTGEDWITHYGKQTKPPYGTGIGAPTSKDAGVLAKAAFLPVCGPEDTFEKVGTLQCGLYNARGSTATCNVQHGCLKLQLAPFLQRPEIISALNESLATPMAVLPTDEYLEKMFGVKQIHAPFLNLPSRLASAVLNANPTTFAKLVPCPDDADSVCLLFK